MMIPHDCSRVKVMPLLQQRRILPIRCAYGKMCHEAQMSLIVLDRNLINTAQGDEAQRHRGGQIEVYTYSEARQEFATLLEQAAQEGEVKIKRKDGRTFVIRPEKEVASPLDNEGIDLSITMAEIVQLVREARRTVYGFSDKADSAAA